MGLAPSGAPVERGRIMESRTIAAIGAALWLAAVPTAFAADGDKAEAKPTPASGEAKDAKRDTDAKGVKAEGPHLRMTHQGANPGGDRDLRHCLDLPTNREIIRCTEGK
jgi:hypothetical protein